MKHELIGLEVRVVESRDPHQREIAGRVVDETRNTLILETPDRELVIPKAGSVFAFQLGGEVRIQGDRLLYRPEDRVKKAR